jgi:N-acyl-phosphatidylethanolamine-hydrolysing phospholipase D
MVSLIAPALDRLCGSVLRRGWFACVAALAQSACSAPTPGDTAAQLPQQLPHQQPHHDPLTARQADGRFHNPEGSPTVTNTWRDNLSFIWWVSLGARKEELLPPVPPGHVLPPQQALAQLAAHAHEDSITWLGHAAFLIRMAGKTVLVDPFLDEYASPLNGIGPRRYAGPGLTMEQLPPVDALVVSHNHYDHLDLRAIRRLPGKDRMQVIVPAGLASVLRDNGFSRVTGLRWGESAALERLRIVSVPAVHFSSRGLFDGDRTLWSGYVFESPQRRVYFAGDTAYHGTVFKELRQRIGPVDVALVPIGAYAPRSLMAHVHVNPEEAVELGRDLGARTLVGMHWGTIVLSTEQPFEPPRRFRAAARAKDYADEAVWTMAIGETRRLAD